MIMNENQEQNVQAPNFEGEEMKMPENTDMQQIEKERLTIINGPLLIILAILLVIILGGMYYWFGTLNSSIPEPLPVIERPTAEENNEPESTSAEAQVEMMQAVSTSDELSAIEADLEATDLDSLDAELNTIDTELEAALQ